MVHFSHISVIHSHIKSVIVLSFTKGGKVAHLQIEFTVMVTLILEIWIGIVVNKVG